jgi:hypothetical protein
VTADDGVRWLARELRERLEPLAADVGERRRAAVSGQEAEYWRGNADVRLTASGARRLGNRRLVYTWRAPPDHSGGALLSCAHKCAGNGSSVNYTGRLHMGSGPYGVWASLIGQQLVLGGAG